ncbi:Splicing factor 3B subunit 4 [Zea mays]|uniref:Splicing factor 3B subunit 4 n=1 Tax=Zea mays TaxID=4577 RepID=A0A3L6DNQ8_MAIZE|nr:Splicing factor 3B subunit 4 [Zea mays]
MARDPARTVFIGNLDEKVSERILYEILIQAGHVVDLHVPSDKESNSLKGYAFVEYETEEIAQYAVKLFSGLVRISGKTLKFMIAGYDKPSSNVNTSVMLNPVPSSNGNNPVTPKLNPIPLPKQTQIMCCSDMPVSRTLAYQVLYKHDHRMFPLYDQLYQVDKYTAMASLCTSDRLEAVVLTVSSTDATATHARTRAPARLSVHDLAPIRAKNSPPSFVPMEVEADGIQEATAGAGDGGGVDDVFFCVAATSRGNKNSISYFHTNAVGEDAESALALAALCLDHAPDHHRWHHHTVAGAKTFAFLSADDGRTYFAAADPSPGAAEVVRFLERVRDACDAAPRKRLRDEAVAPVARQFARTLRAAAGPSSGAELPEASLQAKEPSTPLAPVCEKDEEEHQRAGERRRALQPEESASALPGWRPWWRHASVVIVVDVVLCLVLFAVWMGVCKGFGCLTR